MISSNTKGYLAATASAVCYGMNPLGALCLYQEGVNTNSALFYRFSLASLLLGLTLLIQRESYKITKHELCFLVILGLMFAISSLSYYDSFHYMDAGISSTILFIYPIMVAIIMTTVFHEKLTPPMVVSITIAMIGVTILYYGGEVNLNLLGVILVLASALSYALYMIIVNRAKLKLSATKLTFFATLFCSCFIFIDSLISPEKHLMFPHNGTVWFFAFLLALFPGLLSLLLMAISVRHIGSTKTAIFGALEPVTALCVGVFVFGEILTPKMIVGVILILTSVILVIVAARRQRRQSQSAKVIDKPNLT